ncbi:MAG: GatB/YqeY domain-containing protein [Candidatus Kerfeldbacteria bacterium]|nr:GatB/YqeY domain-containing protein [Candidatus Kerfeldbacteria bacterium]
MRSKIVLSGNFVGKNKAKNQILRMSVFATIQTDMISAMKSKVEIEVSTLRGLKAAIQKDAIDSKGSPDDDQRAFVVLKQEAKKRQDSVQAYRAAGRNDLADQEQAEWELIKHYLPAQLSEAEVKIVVDQVVQANGDNKNFGLLMKQVMQQLDGQADGKVVSTLLKQALTV